MKSLLLLLLCLIPVQLFPEVEKKGSELRVLSYNVWYGFTKQPERKKKFLEYVRSLKPDIVSLQELNSYTEGKLSQDARTWGHPHSALLKTGGFPTGITSRFPIEEVSRTLEGYHHGLLSCKTGGVRVYVVHLHPGHWQIRHREVDLLTRELVKRNPAEKILLAGDFNTFSPRDRKQYEKTPDIIPFFRRLDQRWKSNRNLRDDKLDYTHLEKIEKAGFIDLVAGKRTRFSGTFPTKNRLGEDNGPSRRLDYFYANRSLASSCKSAVCLENEDTAYLSDHYPVLAVFSLLVSDERSRTYVLDPSTKKVTREVTGAQTEMRGGLCYVKGETTPFTGREISYTSGLKPINKRGIKVTTTYLDGKEQDMVFDAPWGPVRPRKGP